MLLLRHGTTQRRAAAIIARGPNPGFGEPGQQSRNEAFSMSLPLGPFHLGTPEEYACLKAALFPNEGGGAIIEVEVPEQIVALATEDPCFPLSQGFVQFDEGLGLEELIAAWPKLRKQILRVQCP